MRSRRKIKNEEVIILEEKFIVKSYFCEADDIQKSMNEHYKNGYYPKEIKMNPFQDRVEGFIVYELKD